MLRTRIYRFVSFVFLILFLGVESAPARMMFLAPDGDDTAPNAAGSVFATLNRALSGLEAGDTLFIRNGSYAGGQYVTFSGTAEAPIVIKGQSLEAVIDTSNRDNRDNLRLDHCSHVVVEGITIRRSSRAGLGIIRSDHITVRGCVMANNYTWGIFTGFASDVLFEDNECYGAKIEHGIYHSNSGDRFIIRHNILHDNAANGLHINGDPTLIDTAYNDDGVNSFGIVEGNIIYGNGQRGGAGINMTHVHDIICRNNLIYGNYAGGFTFYADTDEKPYTSRRALIMNNTVYFKSGGRAAINISSTSSSVVIANNILKTGGSEPVFQCWATNSGSIISDHNVLWGVDSTEIATLSDRITYSLGQWQSNRQNDENSIYADPLFVSLADSNFVPSDSSPAIDLGVPLDSVRSMVARLDTADWLLGRIDSIIADDINGDPRPVGAGFDAGAYEVGSSPQSRYDFNSDGLFNVADALALLLRGLRNSSEPAFDVDGSGSWSTADVVALLRIMWEKPTLLAVSNDESSFY